MPIFWFALLILNLLAGSAEPLGTFFQSPLLTALELVLFWALLAKTLAFRSAQHVLAGRKSLPQAHRWLLSRLDWARWGWLIVGSVGLNLFGYSAFAKELPLAGESMVVHLLMLLAPSLLVVASTWLAGYQFLQWADEQACRSEDRSALTCIIESFRLQAAWIIVPVFYILAIMDLASAAFQGLDGAGTWFGIAALVSLPMVLPALISITWRTSPVDDAPDLVWIAEFVRSLGYRHLRVRRWDTDQRVCTALVAGMVPGFRVLLLSDALLERMDRKATTMVVLHEIAHFARWHMALRLFMLVPIWGFSGWIACQVVGQGWISTISLCAGLLLTMAALTALSHLTELDADRYACVLAEQCGEFLGESFSRRDAAQTLARTLETIGADHPRASRVSWMHPSLEKRLAGLAQVGTAIPQQGFATTIAR